ncbi:MAG TPA: PAS domain-containing protein [Sphingomonas sp.]|nr:PAS domain-containing protein [Sphingomonas sp.]
MILQRTQKQLVGLSYRAITHPGDIARNQSQIAALKPDGSSSRIRKRYIGGDGAVITLEVQISRTGTYTSGYLFGTISTVSSPLISATEPSELRHTPHKLWRRAKDLLGVIRARDAVLGADLCADHAWTTLLIVYVAEAESRIATVDSIVGQLHLPRPTLSRWIRVLQAKALVEPIDVDLDALQLTQSGIDCIERLLCIDAPVAVA